MRSIESIKSKDESLYYFNAGLIITYVMAISELMFDITFAAIAIC